MINIDDLMSEETIKEAENKIVDTGSVEVAPASSEIKTDDLPIEDAIEEEAEPIIDQASLKSEVPKEEEAVPTLDEDRVLEFIRKKANREITSFDELFEEPKVVEKEVNPFEDLYDDYDRGYFKFKKETGLGRKEFEFVQQDFSTKSPLELAYDKVRRDVQGTVLTDDQINDYLEKKLNVDLSKEEIDSTDLIELNSFVRNFKESQIELQKKYKTTESPKKAETTVAMVTLENGDKMPKEKYEQLVDERSKYLSSVKEAVSSATSYNLELAFDNDGDKQTSNFTYEYTEEDKHGMLSNVSDVNDFISKKFRTDKGFDYKGFALFIDKAVNADKYAALIYSQARAEALEQKVIADNNEQFQKVPKSNKKDSADSVDTLLDYVAQN